MHECLYTSETHWQFTGILPIYNGSAESVQNNTHQPTKTVQRKHCMQSTFEDDICCVSNIIVYDKVSNDFIFLSIKDKCPNQNLVAHHQFLENLPGKAFETHWQFTGILIIYNGRHAKSKYLNIETSV